MSGNWLRGLREKLGMTQDELAVSLQARGYNCSRATVSHWENGRYKVPLDDPAFVGVLAKVLGVGVLQILIAAGYDVEPGYSREGHHAAWVVDQLTPSDRDFALEMLERLLGKSHQRER
jgi:transcriptional regulator with XRE-family HTH domain